MDGSIFHVASTVHLCPQCRRITWGKDPLLPVPEGSRDARMTFELTCGWLPDDRCTATSIGMAAHPTEGVIPICKYHADIHKVSLIKPRTTTDKDS